MHRHQRKKFDKGSNQAFGPEYVLIDLQWETASQYTRLLLEITEMLSRAKRGIVDFFYPVFELAGYALVWLSAGYIIWVMVHRMFGDSFIDSFSQIISL